MTRRVFFTFHYQRDVWRVNQIRNIHNVIAKAPAGFHDASLWEEAKAKGDATVQRLIDEGLKNTSVTVVCIGHKTAGRKWINYEIDESIKRGNGIVPVRIHNLKDRAGKTDLQGDVPVKITRGGYTVRTYRDLASLANWIEQAATAAGR